MARCVGLVGEKQTEGGSCGCASVGEQDSRPGRDKAACLESEQASLSSAETGRLVGDRTGRACPQSPLGPSAFTLLGPGQSSQKEHSLWTQAHLS